jgi:hypothetical protein
LLQKDPVGLIGFPYKEMIYAFSMVPSMCDHWRHPAVGTDRGLSIDCQPFNNFEE